MRVPRDTLWQLQVGQRLKRLRLAWGKSGAEIARYLKISAQRLSNYETGLRPFDIELAMKLCKKYGGTLDYIYMGDITSLKVELAEKVAPIAVPPDAPRH